MCTYSQICLTHNVKAYIILGILCCTCVNPKCISPFLTPDKVVGFRLGQYRHGTISVVEPQECVHISDVMKRVVKVCTVKLVYEDHPGHQQDVVLTQVVFICLNMESIPLGTCKMWTL